jgi:hypothetical protein
MSDTLLVIGGLLTPYSARGLRQTLQPISQDNALRRTVNGALVDLTLSAFRKYTSTITASDQSVPALNNVWIGAQVTVDCIVELAYVTSGGSAQRTVVPGSSRVSGAYTFYRPRLTMRIVDYQVELDEWQAEIGWSMRLDEV